MSKTVTVTLSDTVIRKYTDNLEVRDLKDATRPLVYRFRKNRSRGSLYVIKYAHGKGGWHKIGNHPDMPIKTAIAALPEILARLSVAPDQRPVAASGWSTVGEVLQWYAERVANDRSLSKSRKITTQSAIRCQLLPRVESLSLAEVTRPNIDKHLMWPLQSSHSVSYVRFVFAVLKVALKRANDLGHIAGNPLAAWQFSDFIKTKIRPKGARLQPGDINELLTEWADTYAKSPDRVALAVLMLAHGTRIGETRVAKWKSFNLADRVWVIPATDTKTKSAHTLPLTDQVAAFLNRYRATQAASGYDGAYLFPGVTGRPLAERQACEHFAALSLGDWTSHDLRKLARTAWADLGVDYLIGELLLNHALKALDVTYIHTTAEARKREALERWHAWLDERGLAALHSPTARRDSDIG
ncbi:tyrosine-type recombinase/integrase [Pseudomonas zhanjiangensis]|uniref:Tyrosine-type recombinase/integrase n=1 Tax=Pseudomonas zhanjiangensis TaxID=3239015 RepID=A0ABV3YYP9_9PSED